MKSLALTALLCVLLVVSETARSSAAEAPVTNPPLPSTAAVAVPAPAGSVTLTESALLSTRTPVGEASIRLPAGTVTDISSVKGDWIQIRKAPFSGWIRTPGTTPDPGPPRVASLQGEAVKPLSSPTATPTPSPEAKESPEKSRDPLPAWVPAAWKDPRSPLHLILLAYAGFASILLLILLVLVIRLHGSSKRGMHSPKVLSLGGRTPPLPGFVDCPLCASPLAIESLRPGGNQCPNCEGSFECE